MNVPASDLAWCRSLFESLNERGIWGVPRSGLIFEKRGGSLVLVKWMPWMDELAEAAAAGDDVPADAAALRAYQDADYELIRSRFEAAGISVSSEVAS